MRSVRLEGRGLPQFQRIGRLHVVVAVAQHGGLARRVQPVGIDQRMLAGRDDLDFSIPAWRRLSATNCAARSISGAMLGQGADAGDAQELLQLLEQAIVILF